MAKRKKAEAGATPITKVAAVRRTLAAGVQQPRDGVLWIKAHFGIDMLAHHFSAFKSVLNRARHAETPARDEAELLEQVREMIRHHGAEAVRALIEAVSQKLSDEVVAVA